MASNYPGSLDSFDTIASDKKTSDAVGGRTHRAMHNDLGDAIESVQTELGTNPSGSDATVAARLSAIEAGTNLATGAVTSAKIADGTITATDVAASTFAAFGTVGNLLTANQASVETDSSPFGAFLNCTISRSTAHSVHGSACLKAVATADGPFIAGLDAESFPVVPGETITATFALKADREIVGVRVTIQWATGGSPGAFVYRTVTATTSWVTHSLTVVVPSGVETAGLFSWVTIHAAAGSEIYMDCFGVWKGAGGQWAMPGTPIPGGSHIAVNGAVHLSGTGTPEGVVTAAPGSTWLQTDATTDTKGWIRWIKATGTGNTGWVVGAEADTGWRDVSAVALSNGWAVGSGQFFLRRVGRIVSLSLWADGTSASDTPIYTLPSGFTPTERSHAAAASSTTAVGNVIAVPNAAVNLYGYTAATYYITLTWPTDAAWPSSLPGSAA